MLGQHRGVALALTGLAGAAGLTGDYEMSARLLGASGSARRAAGAPSAPAEQAEIDRIAAPAHAALGEAAFRAACRRGSAQAPEDAMTLGAGPGWPRASASDRDERAADADLG
jgi:hypothetical protein